MNNIHKVKPSRSSLINNRNYKNPEVKKQLAKDFYCCCGYCGDSHHYLGGISNYHIDHFAPKSKFEHLKDVYGNLVYSCPYCNISKSNKWVGSSAEEWVVDNIGFIDPCAKEYSNHLGRKNDGSIYYKTQIGQYIYQELRLYLERHKIIYQLSELNETIKLYDIKIDEENKLGRDISKLKQMKSLLCEAFHYYFNSYCYDLDKVLQ